MPIKVNVTVDCNFCDAADRTVRVNSNAVKTATAKLLKTMRSEGWVESKLGTITTGIVCPRCVAKHTAAEFASDEDEEDADNTPTITAELSEDKIGGHFRVLSDDAQ